MSENEQPAPASAEPVRMVRIRHEDGREYAVDPAVIDTLPVGPQGETYAALGFVAYRYDDTAETYPPEAPDEPAAEQPA